MIKYSDHIITAALRYYAEGHSRYECAERFGFTHGQIMYFAKTRGVHGGMSKEQQGEYAKANQKKACEASVKACHERANDKRIRKEWHDLSNDLNQWRRKLKAIQEIQSAKRTKQRLAIVEREIDAMELYEPKIATCKHCGKQWLFWPSHEKYGRRKPPDYCSKEHCKKQRRKKYRGYRNNHRHRAKAYGVDYEPGITLAKIAARDGGVCYLCGRKTDKTDKSYTPDGYQIIGANYPTIDHVIPMCKGGGHTLDNVRLAHKHCNELKSDKILQQTP